MTETWVLAEIVFWANMPRGLLALALIPHLAFVFLQGALRLARGRLRPFLLGKCDTLRTWPETTDAGAKQAKVSAALRMERDVTILSDEIVQLTGVTSGRNHSVASRRSCAELGPVKYPRAKPMAEKGSEPSASVPSNFSESISGIRTPPAANPKAKRARTMIVLKIMLVRTFATKYANGGMGLARFT